MQKKLVRCKIFMKFTDQQQKAVDSRNKNLLVAAAAGSGKTAVLVERIVNLAINDNCDVDKMLIVTFTNAAAQEMRTRIQKNFSKRMETETDSTILAKLERQSVLLSGASIMTFHAFCLSVIKQHFNKIDLDPKFREGNEHELGILRQEVIEKLFEEKYQNSDAEFNKFADGFGGTAKGDSNLHDLILNLHNFAQSRPYPEIWLKNCIENYQNPDAWIKKIINIAKKNAQEIINLAFDDAIKIKNLISAQFITDKKILNSWNKYVEILEPEIKFFEKLKSVEENWDEIYKIILPKFNFKTYPKNKLDDNLQTIRDEMKIYRDDYKVQLENLQKIITLPKSEIRAEVTEILPIVRWLAELIIDFDKNFSAAKRERGIIDFGDMEHLALKIFNSDKNVAKMYRDKFKVIMVDEYQDTNDVQEEIISKIVRENNFFAVGDVKQSIYKFRNAAPENFLQKYKNYPQIENAERIDLSKNFRSRREIVDSINIIFKNLMTEDAMEIDYNADAELNFGADFYIPEKNSFANEKTELIIIKNNQKNANNIEDNEENLTSLEKEAQFIANKITEIKKSHKKIFDGENYREIEYKDIVILLRSADGKGNKIVDILHENNILAYTEDKGGYFNAKEIQTMLSLLSILDNVQQDIPLAAVMLSPIGGFSAEDLAELRLIDRKTDLFTLIFLKAGTENDNLAKKCKNFLTKINNWREIAKKISVPELLTTIYRESGFYDYFNNAAGKIPQANLRILIDRAAEFESTNFRGLSRFIQFIKKIRDLGSDLSAAKTLGENENVVRVMTIHKSKGLEFPVVFVMQLGSKFNLQDNYKAVIAHRTLGIGTCKIVENNFGIKRISTFTRKIIEQQMQLESLAEELRILYVALTRAQEKLFLIGSAKNIIEPIEENFSTNKLQSVKNALTWLMMIQLKAEKFIDYQIIDDAEIKKSEKLIIDDAENAKKSTELPIYSAEKINLPAKISVTELKKRLSDEENISEELFPQKKFIYKRPKFIQEKSLTGAEFGTLMHSVMQNLDLKQKLDAKNISAQIDFMIGKDFFTPEQGKILKTKSANIEKFFSSAIGKKILTAQKIYRELPFNQLIDAQILSVRDEKIFIQGIIDLIFQDSAGNWILIDYKTDKNNSDAHFRQIYHEQIKFYVGAMEQLLQIKIQKKYLYLLNSDRFIEIEV